MDSFFGARSLAVSSMHHMQVFDSVREGVLAVRFHDDAQDSFANLAESHNCTYHPLCTYVHKFGMICRRCSFGLSPSPKSSCCCKESLACGAAHASSQVKLLSENSAQHPLLPTVQCAVKTERNMMTQVLKKMLEPIVKVEMSILK